MAEHDETFSVCTKIQLGGVLYKRSFAPNSSRWSKRYFAVKEGFLLYYPESEKKNFARKGYFNIHPKGVIPVGGCSIEPSSDVGQDFVVKICSKEFSPGYIALGAETQYDQERWIEVLKEAARITWDNSRIEESIIRDLETRGLQLNKEKQSYAEKLQEETLALKDEIDKNEELARVNAALDAERGKLEAVISEMNADYENMKRSYEDAIEAMKLVNCDKKELENKMMSLMAELAELEKDRNRCVSDLRSSAEVTSQSSQETKEMHDHLRDIEEERMCLLEEKMDLERRYQENELRVKFLEEEKQLLSEQSNQLLASITEIGAHRTLTVNDELRLEVSARLEAERQLKLAETSIRNMEGTLETNGLSDDLRIKLMPDVKKLRQFFEKIAEEAKIDANKPIVLKNAVHARKTLVKKARTQILEQTRQEKAKSLGLDIQELSPDEPDLPLKRSLSFMISKKSLTPPLSRTMSLRARGGTDMKHIGVTIENHVNEDTLGCVAEGDSS